MSRKPYATIVDIVDQARRHQLVTLPTLWGLPSQIDAQGRPISQVAEQYEELYHKAPREAARARTAEAIEDALYDLEEAGKPKEQQAAAWQMVTPEHWRLERPPQRTARDRKGRPIPHFGEKFEQFVTMAKRIAPHENAEAFAIRMLDVDRRSIATETQQVDVTRGDDGWVAVYRNGRGPARELLTAPSLPDAIAAATAQLEAAELAAAARNGSKKRNARRWRGRRKRAAQTTSAQAV